MPPAPHKKPAKKAAPKVEPKVEPGPDPTPGPEPEPEPADLLGAFPLPPGHYFHPPVVAPAAHSGAYNEAERVALRSLQRVLNVPESGVYDEQTAAAVQSRGLRNGLVIDEEAWQTLRHG